MTSKKLGCGLLSVLGLVGIFGFGGFYAHKKGFIGQDLTPLRGAKVIPEEAIMTSFISTDSENWAKVEDLGLDRVQELIKQNTAEIKKELNKLNIDYQADIESWLGNAMVAVVPEDEKSKNKNSLLILGVKNPINAYKFLKKVQTQEAKKEEKKAAEKTEVIKYKGVKINLAKDSQAQVTNIALLGNKLVLSDEISAVKQAIDTYKGEAAFSSNQDNLDAIAQPLDLKNSIIQVYIADYDRLLKNTLYDPFVSGEKTNKLQPLKSVVLGVGVEDKRLNIQSFAKLKADLDLTEAQPITNKLASKYPEQTIALINGQGISQFWSDFVTLSEADRDFKTMIKGMRYSTRVGMGLDLDKDIFGWMDGEFALGIVKTDRAIIPEIGLQLGTAIVLETSDRDVAQNTLDSVQDTLQKLAGITPQTKDIKKKKVTQWDFPYTDVDISYSWLDKKNLVLTVGNNVVDAMAESEKNSLEKSPKFQQFTQNFPNKSLGYFYVDVEEILSNIKQIPGLYQTYDPELIAIIESIQGVGSTSTMSDSDTTKTDLVFWFK